VLFDLKDSARNPKLKLSFTLYLKTYYDQELQKNNIIICNKFNFTDIQNTVSNTDDITNWSSVLYNPYTNSWRRKITTAGFIEFTGGGNKYMGNSYTNTIVYLTSYSSQMSVNLPPNPIANVMYQFYNNSIITHKIVRTNGKTFSGLFYFDNSTFPPYNPSTITELFLFPRGNCQLMYVNGAWNVISITGYRFPYQSAGIIMCDAGNPNIGNQCPIYYSCNNMDNLYGQPITSTAFNTSNAQPQNTDFGNAVGNYEKGSMVAIQDNIIVYPHWGLLGFDATGYGGSVIVNYKNTTNTPVVISCNSNNSLRSIVVYFYDIEVNKV
jgi:hypothetical protein